MHAIFSYVQAGTWWSRGPRPRRHRDAPESGERAGASERAGSGARSGLRRQVFADTRCSLPRRGEGQPAPGRSRSPGPCRRSTHRSRAAASGPAAPVWADEPEPPRLRPLRPAGHEPAAVDADGAVSGQARTRGQCGARAGRCAAGPKHGCRLGRASPVRDVLLRDLPDGPVTGGGARVAAAPRGSRRDRAHDVRGGRRPSGRRAARPGRDRPHGGRDYPNGGRAHLGHGAPQRPAGSPRRGAGWLGCAAGLSHEAAAARQPGGGIPGAAPHRQGR